MSIQTLYRAAEWTGWPLGGHQSRRLETYAQWLVDEAIPAGGLGPNEAERVIPRHVADSLLFAKGWAPPHPPGAVIDIGSGVGLPGIPLALLWPDSEVLLVDRAGRRVDLARRAIRVLGLDNVETTQGDAARLHKKADLVVARAVAELDQLMGWATDLVGAGGRVVVGGSWEARPAEHPGVEIVEVPPTVLDRPVWLRIMAAA